jgi:sugar phosphate isomerase/epimerase
MAAGTGGDFKMAVGKDRIGIDIGNRMSPEKALDWAIANDIRYIDVSFDREQELLKGGAGDRLKAVRARLEKSGVHMGLHPASAVNAAELNAYVSEGADAYFDAYIGATAAIGAEWLIVHGGYHFTSDKPARLKAATERLKRMSATAEKAGVVLLLENHNPEPPHAEVRYLAHDLEECQHFFSNLNSPNLRWAFTVNHAHLLPGVGIKKFLAGLDLGRCGEVRIADCRGTIEEHLRIGEGTIDFVEMFSLIEGGGYRGHYMQGYTTLEEMLADRDLLVSLAAKAAV